MMSQTQGFVEQLLFLSLNDWFEIEWLFWDWMIDLRLNDSFGAWSWSDPQGLPGDQGHFPSQGPQKSWSSARCSSTRIRNGSPALVLA